MYGRQLACGLQGCQGICTQVSSMASVDILRNYETTPVSLSPEQKPAVTSLEPTQWTVRTDLYNEVVPLNHIIKLVMVHSCACMHVAGECMHMCRSMCPRPAHVLLPHWLSRYPWKWSHSRLLPYCWGPLSLARAAGQGSEVVNCFIFSTCQM